MPTRGCLNIHASLLLPRWRGARRSSRHRGRRRGNRVTIMQMDVGLDTGDMLLTVPSPSTPTTAPAACTTAWPPKARKTMVAALAQLDALSPQPQPAEGVTYAEKSARPKPSWIGRCRRKCCTAKSAPSTLPGASTLAGARR